MSADFENAWISLIAIIPMFDTQMCRDAGQTMWNARGEEESKPQDPSTCKRGHPRWALVWKKGEGIISRAIFERCSICAEIEAERKRVVEECAIRIANNGKLCRELAVKLSANGEHAMAEMQRIRAEQSEEIAEAIRAHFAGKE